MEAMDDSQEHLKEIVKSQEKEEENPASPKKPIKMKAYTDIVRVQRPEVTRKKPVQAGMTYVGRLQSVSQSEAGTARTEPTQREREMIYGELVLHTK